MASTDEDVYWKSQTVPTIKQYLKDRGVSAGKRKKAELIALAVKAQKLQLKPQMTKRTQCSKGTSNFLFTYPLKLLNFKMRIFTMYNMSMF